MYWRDGSITCTFNTCDIHDHTVSELTLSVDYWYEAITMMYSVVFYVITGYVVNVQCNNWTVWLNMSVHLCVHNVHNDLYGHVWMLQLSMTTNQC